MIINAPEDRGNEIEVVKDTLGYTVGKNLLENTATTTTTKDVTCTVNDDGSVTLNGTATGNVNFSIKENFYLPNGEYILSGCPKGGTMSTYYLALYDGKKTCNDIGEGGTFVVNDNMLQFVRIVVPSGQTVNNLTFYPMIRKADVTDDTYEPCSGIDVDTRLNSIFEWKLHATITGSSNAANLPESYNEILLISKATNSGVYKSYDCFSYRLTKQEIDIYLNGKKSSDYSSFYCTSNTDNIVAIWEIYGNKSVRLYTMKCGSSANTANASDTYTYVYYR